MDGAAVGRGSAGTVRGGVVTTSLTPAAQRLTFRHAGCGGDVETLAVCLSFQADSRIHTHTPVYSAPT